MGWWRLGGGGGVGITSGDNSLCGTKPSGSYDISLQPCLEKKKGKETGYSVWSSRAQITKLFSLCCHQTGQDIWPTQTLINKTGMEGKSLGKCGTSYRQLHCFTI